MLSFIRRIIHSKVGLIVTFAVLIMIAILFGLGDVSSFRGGGGASGDSIASVGRQSIGPLDLRARAERDMDSFRQQRPTLTMSEYVTGGGFDASLDRMMGDLALVQFGRKEGMIVSKRAIDGQIASAPPLQGPDGKFDQARYEQLLQAQRMTDAQLRQSLLTDTYKQQLLAPTAGAKQVPVNLALPYASLLLEKRSGRVAFIPTRAMGAGAEPTDAEIATFYKRNIADYTVPERRVVRYAIVSPESVKAETTPTDTEIAQAYKAQSAQYAPTEKRDIVQVVVADQAAANALAAKVKGGTAMEAAAKAIGLEASTLDQTDKASYTSQGSAALANAAFSAAKGAVVGPLRSPLGWTVAQINTISQIPGKSLEQAKPELVAELTKQKTALTLNDIHDAMDDALSSSATFGELVSQRKLSAQTTPPLLANGGDPDNVAFKLDPNLAPALQAAFAADEGDDPQLVPYGGEGGFAVVALGKVVPAAPRPLAQIKDGVVRDFSIDRAMKAARKAAADVTNQVNKGTSLEKALASTKIKLPGIQPLNASRAQLRGQQNVPPPLALMFSMAENTAKLLEAPNKAGWFIIDLQSIERGDASKQKPVIDGMRADLGKVVGNEYVQQFVNAVQREIGAKKNPAALSKLKGELTGTGESNP